MKILKSIWHALFAETIVSDVIKNVMFDIQNKLYVDLPVYS